MTYTLLMNGRTGEFKLHDPTTRDAIEIGDYIEGYFPDGEEEEFEVQDPHTAQIMTRYRKPFVLTLSALPGKFHCLFDYTPLTRNTFIAKQPKRNFIYAFVGRPATFRNPSHNIIHRYKKLAIEEVTGVTQ